MQEETGGRPSVRRGETHLLGRNCEFTQLGDGAQRCCECSLHNWWAFTIKAFCFCLLPPHNACMENYKDERWWMRVQMISCCNLLYIFFLALNNVILGKVIYFITAVALSRNRFVKKKKIYIYLLFNSTRVCLPLNWTDSGYCLWSFEYMDIRNWGEKKCLHDTREWRLLYQCKNW